MNSEEFRDLHSSPCNHSQVCVWPRALSPNASLSILCVSAALLPSLKQNLMQNPLLLHIINFSWSVRSQNSTDTTPKKNAQKKYTHPQHNAAQQTGSQRARDSQRRPALLQLVRNAMAHAQKPDFVFPRNGRVHLNRWGRQFSRLLAAEVCASA